MVGFLTQSAQITQFRVVAADHIFDQVAEQIGGTVRVGRDARRGGSHQEVGTAGKGSTNALHGEMLGS
jgi:hypothetical protein